MEHLMSDKQRKAERFPLTVIYYQQGLDVIDPEEDLKLANIRTTACSEHAARRKVIEKFLVKGYFIKEIGVAYQL
jgi:hypothetical protein